MSKLASSPANAVVLPLVTLALLAGCSGEPKPDAVSPGPTDTPTVAPPPPAGGSAEAAATPTPSGSPSAVASAKAPPKPSSGGGGTPAVVKQDPTEVTDTFGARPAKLEVGSG